MYHTSKGPYGVTGQGGMTGWGRLSGGRTPGWKEKAPGNHAAVNDFLHIVPCSFPASDAEALGELRNVFFTVILEKKGI